MTMFLRKTHRFGVPIEPITPAQESTWKVHGLVGHMLDPVLPMTFEELCSNVWAYHTEHTGDGHLPDASEIAYSLIRLIETDLAWVYYQ